jgi:hypothetical protein
MPSLGWREEFVTPESFQCALCAIDIRSARRRSVTSSAVDPATPSACAWRPILTASRMGGSGRS